MKGYKLYEGIVNNQIFNEFEVKKGISLFNHSANSCSIDDFLAHAYVLSPDVIEINGYIFISDFFPEKGDEAFERLKSLEKQHNYDKKKIEQWVNSWSLGDFFIGKYTSSLENDDIVVQFGNALVYFWKRRVRELFPDRNIVVETGEDIMGELGISITLYEE